MTNQLPFATDRGHKSTFFLNGEKRIADSKEIQTPNPEPEDGEMGRRYGCLMHTGRMLGLAEQNFSISSFRDRLIYSFVDPEILEGDFCPFRSAPAQLAAYEQEKIEKTILRSEEEFVFFEEATEGKTLQDAVDGGVYMIFDLGQIDQIARAQVFGRSNFLDPNTINRFPILFNGDLREAWATIERADSRVNLFLHQHEAENRLHHGNILIARNIPVRSYAPIPRPIL